MLSTTEASASFASAGFRAMRRSSASIAFSTWALETTRTGGRSFGPTEAASRCRASRSFFSSSRNFAACRSLAPKLATGCTATSPRWNATSWMRLAGWLGSNTSAREGGDPDARAPDPWRGVRAGRRLLRRVPGRRPLHRRESPAPGGRARRCRAGRHRVPGADAPRHRLAAEPRQAQPPGRLPGGHGSREGAVRGRGGRDTPPLRPGDLPAREDGCLAGLREAEARRDRRALPRGDGSRRLGRAPRGPGLREAREGAHRSAPVEVVAELQREAPVPVDRARPRG